MKNDFLIYQQEVADALNDDRWMIEHRCKAIAEDVANVDTAIDEQLNQANGISLVIRTPAGKFLGDEGDKIRINADPFVIQITELPATNRAQAGGTTALGCLARLIFALRQSGWAFIGYRQTDSPDGSVSVITANFRTTFTISDPAEIQK